MSSTPTRCVALTGELDRFILAKVATGHYRSASEVARAALRLMIEREAALAADRRPVPPPAAMAAPASLVS